MIYFVQDTSALHIKIGYTGGDAEDRIRALQTGSPVGLILLATIPGEKDLERQLHQRFAAYRVHGEWFKPAPELIQFILAEKEKQGKKREIIEFPWPAKVYLAGKISATCWRSEIVDGLMSVFDCRCTDGGDRDVDFLEEWPILEKSIFGEHHYVGPHFRACDHHPPEEDDHGCGLRSIVPKASGYHCPELDVYNLCLSAINKADLVFAWIDQPDCYGTIFELGYAAAIKKRIFIAGPKLYRDHWFFHMAASYGGELPQIPHISARIALAEVLKLLKQDHEMQVSALKNLGMQLTDLR